jgi:hypothetical protein
MPRRLKKVLSFEGIHGPHLQGRRVWQEINQQKHGSLKITRHYSSEHSTLPPDIQHYYYYYYYFTVYKSKRMRLKGHVVVQQSEGEAIITARCMLKASASA